MASLHAAALLPPDVREGTRLDDFDLLQQLGSGPASRVFLAWQRTLARRVALKVTAEPPDTAAPPLDHPGIVRAIDRRPLHGLHLFYTAYLPGGSLADATTNQPERSGRQFLAAVDRALAARNEPAAPDTALRHWLAKQSWPEVVAWLGEQLAAALDHAHARNVVHGAVTATNVLLDAEGRPHLTDFRGHGDPADDTAALGRLLADLLPGPPPHGLDEALHLCAKLPAGELAREFALARLPEARQLLRPRPGGWRDWVSRHPLLAIYPAGLIPNMIASAVNINYNRGAVIAQLNDPKAEAAFETCVRVVNLSFFPFALLTMALALAPVSRGLRRPSASSAERTRVRHYALRVGEMILWVILPMWLLSGIIFPLVLHRAVPNLSAAAYGHFFFSQLVCGLIAAAYPFFLASALAVRAFYPALLRHDPVLPGGDDVPALDRLGNVLNMGLTAAALVPLLALTTLALTDTKLRFALWGLSAAGLAGLGVAFLIVGRLNRDREILRGVLLPDEGGEG